MNTKSIYASQVKKVIDDLIQHVALNELAPLLDYLESVYHQDMKIHMIGADNSLAIMNKAQFKSHIAQSVSEAQEPITWADFHLVEADEKNGHIILSRKINLGEDVKIINLSIDFVFENDRWQISREVIFLG